MNKQVAGTLFLLLLLGSSSSTICFAAQDFLLFHYSAPLVRGSVVQERWQDSWRKDWWRGQLGGEDRILGKGIAMNVFH